MQIERPGGVKPGSVTRTNRGDQARGGDFARRLGKGDGAAVAGPVSGVAPLSSVAALLAVQGADEVGAEERRRARKRADDLLGRLEHLRDELLVGVVSRQRLEELVTRLRERTDRPADPQLAELLDEIELRASVELAKLEAI